MSGWGRFTTLQDERVEELITRQVMEIAETIERTLTPSQYRSVVMLGGYGRGEGGVERVGDELRPHNNYDLLVVTRGSSKTVCRDGSRATCAGRRSCR